MARVAKDPYTEACEIAETLVDDFLIIPEPDWHGLREQATRLAEIAKQQGREAGWSAEQATVIPDQDLHKYS